MKALNIVLAVIGGAVAGATVGLLLAPAKGEKTRATSDQTKGMGMRHEPVS